MNNTLNLLYDTIMDRKKDPKEGSYTAYLFKEGLDKILKKVGEESAEVIIASKNGQNPSTVGEISDLIYHLFVLMAELGIDPSEVDAELLKRAGKQGNLKKFRETDKNS